jgi:archaellin
MNSAALIVLRIALVVVAVAALVIVGISSASAGSAPQSDRSRGTEPALAAP